jgi:hypothetical protein
MSPQGFPPADPLDLTQGRPIPFLGHSIHAPRPSGRSRPPTHTWEAQVHKDVCSVRRCQVGTAKARAQPPLTPRPAANDPRAMCSRPARLGDPAPLAVPSPRGPVAQQRPGPTSSAGCTVPQIHMARLAQRGEGPQRRNWTTDWWGGSLVAG